MSDAALPRYPAAGVHVIADLSQIDAALLADAAKLERILNTAALAAGATVLSRHFHHFGSAAGVTGVVLLAESHISLHTWPEAGFAALDIFMCGRADVDCALAQIVAALNAKVHQVQRVVRGAAGALAGAAQASPTRVK